MKIFGIGTMISTRFLLDTKSHSCTFVNDTIEKLFSKPLYQTWVMFFGMTVCLPIYWLTKCFGFFKRSVYDEVSVLNEEEKIKKKKMQIKNYFFIGVPATFDLLATTLMTFSLIYISESIIQILRGSLVIFSGFLTVFFRKVFSLCNVFF